MKVDYSLIHRLFYPQVPLVMSAQYGGRVSAMPVVSYASVSDKPPMVAVACTPGGFTCELAQKAGSFSLCILDRREMDAFARLATVSGTRVRDKLTDAGLVHTVGTKLKVPVVRRAFATLECKLRSMWRTGDHMLLLAEVCAAYSTRAFVDFWDYTKYRPLLYTGWRGGMTTYPDV